MVTWVLDLFFAVCCIFNLPKTTNTYNTGFDFLGWTNYHKHVVASQAFSYVNNILYLLPQRWAKHRHPNKNNWWRLNRYWHEKNGKPWVFMTDEHSLINLRRIHIVRHPKLQISKTPFLDAEYFIKRRLKLRSLVAA